MSAESPAEAVSHCRTCRCFKPRPKKGNSGGIKRTPDDARFSKMIRERDRYTCQWPGCGSVFETNSSGLSAAHCFSRRIKATRLDPENAVSLCTAHHFHADSHPMEKYELFRARLGDEAFDALSARAHAKRDRRTA